MMAALNNPPDIGPVVDPNLVTIVLVEDDNADAKAINRSMRKARIANPIIRACDGLEALDLLRGKSGAVPPRYIMLIDINMPRMSGLELLAEIRRDAKLAKTVAFMLTTSSDDRDVSAAYGLHVAGYIVKERVGRDFVNLVDTLGGYWKIVELPDMN